MCGAYHRQEVPLYYDMIKSPMWLKKVTTNISRSVYRDMESFERDMMQIWTNARIYNVDGSEIFELANELEALFQQVYQAKLSELNLNKSANASTYEGTPGLQDTPRSSGPKLKLKMPGSSNGRNGNDGRPNGRKSQRMSDDDDDEEEEEEDARMSDSD